MVLKVEQARAACEQKQRSLLMNIFAMAGLGRCNYHSVLSQFFYRNYGLHTYTHATIHIHIHTHIHPYIHTFIQRNLISDCNHQVYLLPAIQRKKQVGIGNHCLVSCIYMKIYIHTYIHTRIDFTLG